jgi:ferric-dicitrate binding protein FerR (iron transport regulator)
MVVGGVLRENSSSMTTFTKISSDLLDRYLAGEATPREVALVMAWIGADSVRRELVGQLHGMDVAASEKDGAGQYITNAEIMRAKRALLERVAVGTPVTMLEGRGQHEGVTRKAMSKTVALGMPGRRFGEQGRSVWRTRTWQVAFASLGVALVTLLSVSASRYFAHRADSGAMTTYVTSNGQRATIQLGDGTQVVMNVASRISIPENFSREHRTVHLVGEAYFNVAHTNGAPFIVDANGVQTRVLGTAFGVRAYNGSDVQVAVRDGRVVVNDSVLSAGDVAERSGAGVVSVQHNQALGAAFGFVTGRLVLNGIPLRDAVEDLDRWYDADIRIASTKLGATPIYAVLRSGSIADLKEILQSTFGADVIQQGRVLTLTLAGD